MKRPTAILSLIASAAALSACGGSSTAPGVVLAPSGGATAPSATSSTTPTAPTSTATTQTSTPKSGPLSSKPTVSIPSGPAPTKLVTKDLITGTGATAKSGSTITVNYVGELYNGKEFDSSWSRNQTFSTPLSNGSVIPGWVQGIQGMKVGGRRELIIPPSLGYGKSGSGSTIPPNSTLVFVVDLLSVS